MIIRDLFRCSTDDLHKAFAASTQALLYRRAVQSPAALGPGDIEYLAAHPDFDPALSFVAFDAGEPVACLVSRIEDGTAVWSLLGGSGHGLEMLLDEAMDHWRRAGARRARQGCTGLLGTRPNLADDAELVALLTERGFEVRTVAADLALGLKKLSTPAEVTERETAMRPKGYSVRPARPDEVAVVARQYQPRLTGQCTQEFWNCFARHLRADALVVLDFRRQLVGCAAYLGWTLESDCPQLGPLLVDDAPRQAGLGAVLLHHAVRLAREYGKERVGAHRAEPEAAPFERAGFQAAARYCAEAVAELG